MLKKLIIDLYETVNSKTASSDIHTLVNKLLEENDLLDESKVPKWFMEFIQTVITQKAVGKVFFHL